MPQVNGIALVVFVLLFGFITWLGFAAARWRRGDLDQLHEWGLGGRRFGTVVTWFLVGGDIYTAYTFIAVPALAWLHEREIVTYSVTLTRRFPLKQNKSNPLTIPGAVGDLN